MSVQTAWQDDLYEVLRKSNVKIFSYVPDGGHKTLINRSLADPAVEAITLTTEQEGVALAAGAHLGGVKSVLLMQSSGVGNCMNMLSLISNGQFPFLTIVTMRGEFGEGNAWQVPMGQGAPATLEAMGVKCLRADGPNDVVPCASAALTMAFQSRMAIALLLSQRLLGAKAF
ncbi:phosphonopyruvate decarboxylase [Bradyrhizobium sp. LTSP885]|uniref:phosphonopyruvate decarboxylase n=1 Tax=Bradyrhizobium sp. LTSP885 TaxID=1619232 RepID=UPI0005C818D1|nr:phosphonopyruvate decarboxylase [Bradyrhizobium sp. LTSP885]KJC50539.1 phosphonopyruvate decarboxylase [Bradyrhizobium sp. LTSP885]